MKCSIAGSLSGKGEGADFVLAGATHHGLLEVLTRLALTASESSSARNETSCEQRDVTLTITFRARSRGTWSSGTITNNQPEMQLKVI